MEEKVFAIDFDERAVRVVRTLNLIAGDGQTNVLHLNTLDYELWDEVTQQEEWDEIYHEGFKRLKRLRPKGSKDYREFRFDVLMANPPFAGDIKEPRMIARYDLAKKPNGKWETKVGRDILFIERNLDREGYDAHCRCIAAESTQSRWNAAYPKGYRRTTGKHSGTVVAVV